MKLQIRDRENGNEVIAELVKNHGMTREEICEACGIELAITQEDYEGMPENGKYDIENLDFCEASDDGEKMKTYNIIDLDERNGRADAHSYTWEEVLDFFRPEDDPELEEDHQRFEKIKDISDLREFLEWQADGMRVHYEIREDDDKELECKNESVKC